MNVVQQFKDRRKKRIDDKWITVHPNGGEGKHVLLGENGEVKGGAGGSMNGETMTKAESKPLNELPKTSTVSNTNTSSNNANTALKTTKPSSHDFKSALIAAKQTCPPESAWRVSTEYKESEYHDMDLHKTDGGSTYAIHNGDIVSVCKHANDTARGKDLIADAVANGGTKLDSYEGNFGFYLACGFEPVSWCEWNDLYAPDGWDETRDQREDIIFFKYTGNKQKMTAKESLEALQKFKQTVPSTGDDYDAAYKQRDEAL